MSHEKRDVIRRGSVDVDVVPISTLNLGGKAFETCLDLTATIRVCAQAAETVHEGPSQFQRFVLMVVTSLLLFLADGF